ncbi:hypothetical protein E3N88_03022 [Mikania micrantha]|uniref:Diaminopimelate epimerase n=1 Tax=Mikania micrantha TaxID=192012 RepID=A0A5N6Q793_9ASTR|nr:hypothetical protein E3N88_03022 [Mikania micrantha]
MRLASLLLRKIYCNSIDLETLKLLSTVSPSYNSEHYILPLLVLIHDMVVDELNMADVGPKFEHHKLFSDRTNTGATLACGTGVCSVVVAAILEGRYERVRGPLEIEWREDDNHVYMMGPAEVVFYGSVQL